MTYCDEAYAIAYFAQKLHTEAWDEAEQPTRLKALSHASLILNRLNYLDAKTDPLQTDEWPRYATTVFPDQIKQACCEIAISLLDGIDPDLEYKNSTVLKDEFGQIKTTYDGSQTPEHTMAGVPSITAWRLVLPWLRDNRSITLQRAN